MDEAPRRSANDSNFTTSELFRDAAANILRRRVTEGNGDAAQVAANDPLFDELCRWKALALHCQRQIDQINDWMLEGVRQSGGYPLPRFLANLRSHEEFKQFVLELILPDLVDIIDELKEENHRDNHELPDRSSDTRGEEETAESEAVADGRDDDERKDNPSRAEEEDVPF